MCTLHVLSIQYNTGNFKGETFTNFAVLCLSARLFLCARWTVGSTSKQSMKVFSTKSHFSTNLRKFSPSKDSRYTVKHHALSMSCYAYRYMLHAHTQVDKHTAIIQLATCCLEAEREKKNTHIYSANNTKEILCHIKCCGFSDTSKA